MTYCIFPDDHLWMAKALGISICLVVISGYFVRTSSALFAWEAISFRNLVATPDGGDQIAANLAILITILAVFENRKNHWHKSASFSQLKFKQLRLIWSVLSLAAIKIQMAYLYFEAGLAKTQVEPWANGSEVYYVLGSPSFGVPADIREALIAFLVDFALVVQILTWGTILVEVFIAYAIFGPIWAKKTAAVLVIFLHGGIGIFLGLPVFSLIMVCGALYSLVPMGKLNNSLSSFFPLEAPKLERSRKDSLRDVKTSLDFSRGE